MYSTQRSPERKISTVYRNAIMIQNIFTEKQQKSCKPLPLRKATALMKHIFENCHTSRLISCMKDPPADPGAPNGQDLLCLKSKGSF